MPNRLPSLRALRALDATARLGSFTAAAAELHVTQGAVSRQVQELERLLGVDLVSRNGPNIALTEQGRRFAKTAQTVLRELQHGVDAFTRADAQQQVTLTMLPSVAVKWFAPRLGAFLAQHPNIDLKISTSRRLLTLGSGGIDAAIRYGRGSWPGLSSKLLAPETVFPVCAPAYAESRPLKSPPDLLNATLLPAEIAEDWPTWFAAAGVRAERLRQGPQLGDYTAILQAAIDGHGIALGRSLLVADDVKAGRLVQLGGVALRASSSYWFVVAENAPRSEGLSLVHDWIVRAINSELAHGNSA